MMKLLIAVTVFQLPLLLFSQQVSLDSLNKAINQKKQEITGRPFHKFTYSTGGTTISNADLDSNIVFMNFWYASCAPCMAEMEALNKLYDTFSVNSRFKFLSFTFEKNNIVQKVIKERNLKFPVLTLGGNDCDSLRYNFAFPTSIILNDSGIVKYISPGASLNSDKNIAYFRKAVYPVIAGELNKLNR